jgi:hypothetical protein
MRPDIVVTDGNSPPADGSINPDTWNELKAEFGFRLVTYIADCYDREPPMIGLWRSCTDLFISFHTYAKQLVDVSNVAVFPSLMMDEAAFDRLKPKMPCVSYFGSNTRYRMFWMLALRFAGVPIRARMGDTDENRSKAVADYCAEMSEMGMTFNNGLVSPFLDILTGRVTESILAGSLLFQEEGPAIRDYYAPFIHYVPVSNADQLIAFSRFFLQAEDWRTRITEAAFRFWKDHYDSAFAWRYICRTVLERSIAI